MYVHTDFQTWKDEFEKETSSQFVKATGEKIGIENRTTYYYCNRSGYFTSNSTGKRKSPEHTSSKLDSYCTAAIVATVSDYTNYIKIYVCKTHYGHECRLGYTRLQSTLRQCVAGKLTQGVEVDRILDDVRDNIGGRLERIHLITRKDIANIERAYGLRGHRRHDDDATSVRLWVDEMESKGDKTPVLVYKEQGKNYIEWPNLHKQDFVIVIQTPFQAEMLKLFGPGNVICVDATHKTNGYDFQLVTLLVVDEFGEGFPIGWCLSNRTDLTVMLIFLKEIKERVGDIQTNWIMSDDADQFFSAWVGVFGVGPQKLLCTWHVDRAWRSNLKSITNQDTAQLIYHNLRILLEETDKKTFDLLLAETHRQLSLSPETKDFLTYFNSYYMQRKDQWALCYRKSSFISTNMYVESFHRVLKYIYLKGKTNKRVDKCIQVLMKYARDKTFDRLIKLEKSKLTGRVSTISKRHNASRGLSTDLVTSIDDCTWYVRSADTQQQYTVVRELQQCTLNCFLRCSDCGICVHMYYCNCMDAVIRHTICKHIDLVVR